MADEGMKSHPIFLAMEMVPWMWDIPLGAYETRKEAEGECKRLARDQLAQFMEAWKKKRSTERLLSPTGYFMDRDEHEGYRESGWGIYSELSRKTEKRLRNPRVVYYIKPLVIGKKAKPFWRC